MNAKTLILIVLTTLTVSASGATDADLDAYAESKSTLLDNIDIGGLISATYDRKEFGDRFRDNGKLSVPKYELILSYDDDSFFIKYRHRFFDWYGYDFPAHFMQYGYVGYRFENSSEIQAGVIDVPMGFGIYPGYSLFENIHYYAGLADDYDLGVKYTIPLDNWVLDTAFFFEAEPDGKGMSRHAARYSADVIPEGDARNQEGAQLNLRAVRKFGDDSGFSGNYGASFQIQEIRNLETDKSGMQTAVSLHTVLDIGNFEVQLSALSYEYDLKNPDGISDDIVTMGNYDWVYDLAAAGVIYSANACYKFNVENSFIDSFMIYCDTSMLEKRHSYTTSAYVSPGFYMSKGSYSLSVDYMHAKANGAVGPNGNSFGEAKGDYDWNSRLYAGLTYTF